RQAIGRDGCLLEAAVVAGPGRAQERVADRVFARQVEQVDAAEYDEEAAQQRYGVDGVGRVEAAEHDEGGAECSGGECDVVERVNSGWKRISLPELAAA